MKPSDKVVEDYFNSLLSPSTEPPSVPQKRADASAETVTPSSTVPVKKTDTSAMLSSAQQELQLATTAAINPAPLQRLLEGISDEPRLEPGLESRVTEHSSEPLLSSVARADEPVVESLNTVVTEVESALATEVEPVQPPVGPYLPEAPFQVLYFEVAGMLLAVPLEQLGGIYNLADENVSKLIGKPAWFKGLMSHRERQLNVVDTALWVMPEKYNEELAKNIKYQYLVMLKDSGWGLACETLVTTQTIDPAAVNWRKTLGKRPWLRGMVKEKMCALLNIDALIELLDTGLNSQNS